MLFNVCLTGADVSQKVVFLVSDLGVFKDEPGHCSPGDCDLASSLELYEGTLRIKVPSSL